MDSVIRPVYEECEKTAKTLWRIEHVFPSDLILNTAQMRDASYVQRLRIQVEHLDREWAIHNGATAELAAQKVKASKTPKTKTPRGALASGSSTVPSRTTTNGCFYQILH